MLEAGVEVRERRGRRRVAPRQFECAEAWARTRSRGVPSQPQRPTHLSFRDPCRWAPAGQNFGHPQDNVNFPHRTQSSPTTTATKPPSALPPAPAHPREHTSPSNPLSHHQPPQPPPWPATPKNPSRCSTASAKRKPPTSASSTPGARAARAPSRSKTRSPRARSGAAKCSRRSRAKSLGSTSPRSPTTRSATSTTRSTS